MWCWGSHAVHHSCKASTLHWATTLVQILKFSMRKVFYTQKIILLLTLRKHVYSVWWEMLKPVFYHLRVKLLPGTCCRLTLILRNRIFCIWLIFPVQIYDHHHPKTLHRIMNFYVGRHCQSSLLILALFWLFYYDFLLLIFLLKFLI